MRIEYIISLFFLFIITVSLLKYYFEKFTNEIEYLKNKIYNLEVDKVEIKKTFSLKENILLETISNNKKEINDLNNLLIKKELLYNDINNINDKTINKICTLFTDYTLLQYKISSEYLENKKRPALKEAKRIDELRFETKQYIEQYKIMLYKYEFLLNTFPDIENYIDDFESLKELNSISKYENIDENYDYSRKYLSKDEYDSLDIDKRNQLALDNYIKRKKSNWQIGRDYELMCGLDYENKGWKVEYTGMEKKINDMGRDLIAYKEEDVHVIQCKYWSNKKIIHEKHILQLYATTKVLEIPEPIDLFKRTYSPVFITNIDLSERAKKFAKILNVKVIKLPFKEFPRIKCNINGDSKIYHLPFDQKYDLVQIKNEG